MDRVGQNFKRHAPPIPSSNSLAAASEAVSGECIVNFLLELDCATHVLEGVSQGVKILPLVITHDLESNTTPTVEPFRPRARPAMRLLPARFQAGEEQCVVIGDAAPSPVDVIHKSDLIEQRMHRYPPPRMSRLESSSVLIVDVEVGDAISLVFPNVTKTELRKFPKASASHHA